jgi:signal peptidase I
MLVVTALVGIGWGVITLVFDSERAPSSAMEPTVGNGDALVVRPGTDARRGDIVVVRVPPEVGRGTSTSVLRVIGVGGDRLGMEAGRLVLNGRVVREPYVRADQETTTLEPVRVPRDAVYVLGDLRTEALDSRSYGPVPRSRLAGRVVLVGVDLPRIALYALAGALVLLVITVAAERSTVGRGDVRWHPSRGW